MRRRHFPFTLASLPSALSLMTPLSLTSTLSRADSSSPSQLAAYYDHHLALREGVVFGWRGEATRLRRLRAGVRQVGVSEDASWALLDDARLVRWPANTTAAQVEAASMTLMRGVASFACGQSGWFAIDTGGVLWRGAAQGGEPQRVADEVVESWIGDSADYVVRRDGTLWVQGLAHRGQYGDGKLVATADFVPTAREVVAVRAHTGHAIHLSRSGVVMGTGGNRFGPLSHHGLGDKADRWGPIFEGARAIATGSRHSLAIRQDDHSLWAWGEGFGITPRQIASGIRAVAAGNSATIALQMDGSLLQWDGGRGPRRLAWP